MNSWAGQPMQKEKLELPRLLECNFGESATERLDEVEKELRYKLELESNRKSNVDRNAELAALFETKWNKFKPPTIDTVARDSDGEVLTIFSFLGKRRGINNTRRR
ncbi:hypothetical protein LguiA_022900 [Lonicera macranthoides]